MRLQQTARKTPPHLQTHKTGNISSLAAGPSKAKTFRDKAQPGRRQGLDQEKFEPEGFFLFATRARRLLFFSNIYPARRLLPSLQPEAFCLVTTRGPRPFLYPSCSPARRLLATYTYSPKAFVRTPLFLRGRGSTVLCLVVLVVHVSKSRIPRTQEKTLSTFPMFKEPMCQKNFWILLCLPKGPAGSAAPDASFFSLKLNLYYVSST